MRLGNNIYAFRIQKNMSQGDLAEALEVSRQSVSKWENNSATPELEKLIRMSELFGVTLDELVGRTNADENGNGSETPPSPPVQQVIIHHQFRPITLRQVIGIVLIIFGFLFLPFALSATSYTPMFTCLILCGAFSLCGLSILLIKYPYIPCGWILLSAFTLYIFLLCHWETSYFSLTTIAFALGLMILLTVHAHVHRLFHIPNWLWWMGGIALAFLLLLFCVNFIPPFWISSTEHTAHRS